MNELAEAYAALGRKTAALDKLTDEYGRFLGIVRAIKMGEVSIDRLSFSNGGNWSLVADNAVEKQKPEAEPA